MGLFDRFFTPKITKLENKGDIDGIIALLESEAPSDIRVAAVQALARAADEGCIECLIAHLADADSEVTDAAASAVQDLGPTTVDALVNALESPSGPSILKMLLSFGAASVEPLRDASQALDASGRRHALTGLIQLGRELDDPDHHETVFRALLAAVGDRSPQCRVLAAETLEDLADARAARALAAQLKDGDEHVRDGCSRALRTIGAAAVPNLLGALEDRNPNSRLLAAGLLGEICAGEVELNVRREALSVLANQAKDSNTEISSAVRRAIENIPREELIASQLELLADPDRYDLEEIRGFLEQMLEHGALQPGDEEKITQAIQSQGSQPSN